MKVLLRSLTRFFPIALVALLAGCPQMTSGVLDGGGAPLNATGDKSGANSSASDGEGATAPDEAAPPAASAPLPSPAADAAPAGGEYTTMMRRMDGDVARESGGILSAPSAGERLGDPLYRLYGNVLALKWSAPAEDHATCDAFNANLDAGDEALVPVDSRCELMGVVDVVTQDGQVTEAQVPDRFPNLTPGEYLFFLPPPADGRFLKRLVHSEKTFSTLDELRTALHDAKCIGGKTVAAASPLGRIPSEDLRPSLPGLEGSPALQRGVLPGLIHP